MLTLIIGPMFAGKTTELIRQVRRNLVVGKKCILLKPEIDTRSAKDIIETHDNVQISCETFELNGDYNMFDVIAIDEGQFINDLVIFCERHKSKTIIISALSGTFQQKMFPNIIDVIPIADKIKHLRAICSCGNKASFTKALDIFDVITIGGADKYTACCKKCH